MRVTTNTLANSSAGPHHENPLTTFPDASFEVLEPKQLGDSLRCDWQDLRASSAAYRSPFFSTVFYESLAQCAPSARLAVARKGSQTVGLLPFQFQRNRHARPAGLGINDAHGLLTDPAAGLSLTEVLSGCGLQSYNFHAAPPDSPDVAAYEVGRTRSFLADLTVDPDGYEHYLRSQSTTIDRQGQKTRKLARNMGPLSFEFDCRDPAMLDLLIRLKREQYQRTHTYDILGLPWIQQLLHTLHQLSRSDLFGILSILYAGSTPVAMHYGMLENDLLHYWFPVFEPQYSYGSPGTQLFLEVAREAAQRGVTAIDMGYGEQAYKYKLTNVITEMSYGLVDNNPLRRLAYRSSLTLKAGLKNIPAKETIKPFLRKVFPGFGGATYKL